MSAFAEALPFAKVAYMTRWRAERRMPPLKIESASPMLQTAWPGRGCGHACQRVTCPMTMALTLMYSHRCDPGGMTCKPPRRLCRNVFQ